MKIRSLDHNVDGPLAPGSVNQLGILEPFLVRRGKNMLFVVSAECDQVPKMLIIQRSVDRLLWLHRPMSGATSHKSSSRWKSMGDKNFGKNSASTIFASFGLTKDCLWTLLPVRQKNQRFKSNICSGVLGTETPSKVT